MGEETAGATLIDGATPSGDPAPATTAPATSATTDPAAPAAAVTPDSGTPATTDPATDPAKPATDPAKPATDPAKPATDPAKPATDPAKEEAPQGAPEEYADFQAPEGVTLDPAVLTDFKAWAKENNLSQDAAQSAITKLAPQIAKQNAEAFAAHVRSSQEAWMQESLADPELGHHDKGAENRAVAKMAMEKFVTPEMRQILNESRLGDNVHVLRTFLNIGKAISEDGFVMGAGAKGDALDRMYPSMKKE